MAPERVWISPRASTDEVPFALFVATTCFAAVNLYVYAWRRRYLQTAKAQTGPAELPGSAPWPAVMSLEAVFFTELWTYLASMACQLLVYPFCVLCAWIAWCRGDVAGSWLDRPGGLFNDRGPDLFWLRVFLYAFFAYLARDLPESWHDRLMVGHHTVCMLGILVALAAPVAGVPIALGMFAFECGSFCYNLWSVDSTLRCLEGASAWLLDPRMVTRWYKVAFTVSNVVGARMLYLTITRHLSAGHPGFAGFFLACGLPLLLLRQKECASRRKPGPLFQMSLMPAAPNVVRWKAGA